MKRQILFLLVLYHSCALSQINPEKYSVSGIPAGFNSASFFDASAKDNLPTIVVAIPGALQRFNQDDKLLDSLRDDSTFRLKEKRLHAYDTRINYDSSEAIFFARNITNENAANYEYRVLLDNSNTLLKWQPISDFKKLYHSDRSSDNPTLAYLGKYKTTWNHFITVDLREVKSDSIVSSVSILWKPIKPRLSLVFTGNELNDFFKVLQNSFFGVRVSSGQQKYSARAQTASTFSASDHSLIFVFSDMVNDKELMEYRILTDNTTTNWKPNDFDSHFIWLKELLPGKYKLQVRYRQQRHNVTEYEFEIKSEWHQTLGFKILGGSLIAAFFGFIMLLFRLKNQQRKARINQIEKEKKEIELKVIRSQLNPHFIFNALNSIQGLVNNNELNAANRYISELGILMRDTLDGSDKNFNSLENEIKMLNTYLQLEQLRFEFKFNIQTDKVINATAIDIPSLLLQPLIENAIKHGISDKQQSGLIELKFLKDGVHLIAIITDNGGNYSEEKNAEGYGLKLTRERINLLNQLLKDQTIQVAIRADKNFTIATVTFKNWLV